MDNNNYLLAVIDSEHPNTPVTVEEVAKWLAIQGVKTPTPSWWRERPAKSLVQNEDVMRFLTLKIKSHAGKTSRNS